MAANEPKRGDFSSLLKWALGRGWSEIRNGKHTVLQWGPTGRKCVLPKTASDHRAWLNAYKTMQRIEREPGE
jgi:hypothetical protein